MVNKVASDRDLTLHAPVKTGDEVGMMAKEFNNMIGELRGLPEGRRYRGLGGGLLFPVKCPSGPRPNKERATDEERQMGVIQETVNQMGDTAGEVAQFSHSQRDAANVSYRQVESLIESMRQMGQASAEQIQEANIATERVNVMGETGAMVVATAGKQGEQVAKATESVKRIDGIVAEMTQAAGRATEHGQGVLTAAQEGARSVKETVQGMQAIAESSEKIADIISVITDISPSRPTCWHSTQPSKRPVQAFTARVLPWLPTKSVNWPSDLRKRPRRSGQLIKESTNRVQEGTPPDGTLRAGPGEYRPRW